MVTNRGYVMLLAVFSNPGGAPVGGGEPPGSPNPDPIPDQKTSFSAPVFRPDFLNPYPFSDLAF